MSTPRKRRVLLKLSGEAFGGGTLGVNPDVVSQIAREIGDAMRHQMHDLALALDAAMDRDHAR